MYKQPQDKSPPESCNEVCERFVLRMRAVPGVDPGRFVHEGY